MDMGGSSLPNAAQVHVCCQLDSVYFILADKQDCIKSFKFTFWLEDKTVVKGYIAPAGKIVHNV